MNDKKVSVKFYEDGRWAIDLENQISFYKGQVINNIDISFAKRVVEKNKGEIVIYKSIADTDNIKIYSISELSILDMDSLRAIGDYYQCKDIAKDNLIKKIIKYQIYDTTYLLNDSGSIKKQKEIMLIAEYKDIIFDKKNDSLEEITNLIVEHDKKSNHL